MKIVEQYGIPTIYVDDYSGHQIINGNVHAIGYRVQSDPGGETIGVTEVRLVQSAKSFFAACRRGLAMAEAGELLPEVMIPIVPRAHH